MVRLEKAVLFYDGLDCVLDNFYMLHNSHYSWVRMTQRPVPYVLVGCSHYFIARTQYGPVVSVPLSAPSIQFENQWTDLEIKPMYIYIYAFRLYEFKMHTSPLCYYEGNGINSYLEHA